MFAVIKTGGKQHRVAEGDVIIVEKLEGEAGDAVSFDQVLMIGEGDDAKIGAPLLSGAVVTGEIAGQRKGDKIIVFKKKRRQNYRRKKGHRQLETVVTITGISESGAPAKKAAAKKAAPKAEDPAPAAAEALFSAPAGDKDDLKKISGVGPVLEKKLNDLGITRFDQIAAFTQADIDRVDERLNFKGRIEREDWLGQAAKLAKGEE